MFNWHHPLIINRFLYYAWVKRELPLPLRPQPHLIKRVITKYRNSYRKRNLTTKM